MIHITPGLKRWLVHNNFAVESALDNDDAYGDSFWQQTAARAMMADNNPLTGDKLEELTKMKTTSPDPAKVFAQGNDDPHIRVKNPSERYDETRVVAKSAKTGRPVFDPVYQRNVAEMSEASKARAGVLFKHIASRSRLFNYSLDEHEKAMLGEMMERQAWAGNVNGEYYEHIGGGRVKALIDDNTSGGLEIVPIEFDSDIITFPLLHGELFPEVDLKPVPRGRRIEGASINTPTMSWGGGDDTSITPFTTTSMVAAIDTTIFTIDGAIEVGRDAIADSPVEVGTTLTGLVGERLMNSLDAVVANGDGTTQPEGIFQKSGVSTVNTDNGNTGPPTLADYQSLMFTVGKQYRKEAYRPRFVTNDTSYQRSKSIRVDDGGSTDQRPVMSPLTQINDYVTLGWGHRVENNLANTVAAFVAMMKYRLYRRLGIDIRFVEGGRTLALKNEVLMVYRARFGGQLMDANACAKWTDGQS